MPFNRSLSTLVIATRDPGCAAFPNAANVVFETKADCGAVPGVAWSPKLSVACVAPVTGEGAGASSDDIEPMLVGRSVTVAPKLLPLAFRAMLRALRSAVV